MRPDIEAIKARSDAATMGPWKWGGVLPHTVDLRSMTSGIPYVMMFRRMGMQGAQPEFAVGRKPGVNGWKSGGIMTPAKELAVKEASYRGDIAYIDNPDAEFIAHSRADVPALLAYIEHLEALVAQKASA